MKILNQHDWFPSQYFNLKTPEYKAIIFIHSSSIFGFILSLFLISLPSLSLCLFSFSFRIAARHVRTLNATKMQKFLTFEPTFTVIKSPGLTGGPVCAWQ